MSETTEMIVSIIIASCGCPRLLKRWKSIITPALICFQKHFHMYDRINPVSAVDKADVTIIHVDFDG